MIFLHMRRFRPGGQLDAALITVSCAAIIGFARGASTDMQLAAPFCIGMLGWYAWYETGKKFWLFDLYFFGAAATLAKGPVAPFLALGIILLFLGLRREWSALRRTIWIPGVLLYLVMVLPWYIAVQRENPTFVHSFFLEHNLERFATNLYEHHQPFWYYVAVLLVGLMPWTVIAIRAVVAAMKDSIAEWKVRGNPKWYLGQLPRGRRLSRVPGAVGAVPSCLLHLFQVEAARLHSAFHPAHHHSYRRLSESHSPGWASQVAAVVACGRLRGDDLRASTFRRSTWRTRPWCPRRAG